MNPAPRLGAGLLLALLPSCISSMPGGEPVTPQRPTLSNNTKTTAESSFELQAGGIWDPGNTLVTPTELKYGAGPKTELYLGWYPIVYDDPTTTVGPMLFGARHRYYEGSGTAPSAAVQVSVTVPTGNNRLDSGEEITAFASIVSGNVDLWDYTGYASFDLVGDPVDKGVDPGATLALAGGRPIQGKWAGYGEVAGVFVPDQNFDPIFSFIGATYQFAQWLVFDVGVLVGYNSDAPDFSLTFGLTRNFGRMSVIPGS